MLNRVFYWKTLVESFAENTLFNFGTYPLRHRENERRATIAPLCEPRALYGSAYQLETALTAWALTVGRWGGRERVGTSAQPPTLPVLFASRRSASP